MSYFITKKGYIVNAANQLIPQEEGNLLYLAYLDYLNNGGEVLPTNYEAVTQADYIDAIKSKYEKYKADGVLAYDDFRAKVVLKVRTHQLTQAQGVEIKRYLGAAYDEINTNGDWVTAHAFLSETQIPEEVSYVNDYKTEALAIMANYIDLNFPK